MKRDRWKFTYSAQAMYEASEAKLAFHQGRLSWWKEKYDATMKALQSEGVEISETIVDAMSKGGYANSYTQPAGQRATTVKLNEKLVGDLMESREKIKTHRYKVSDYTAWVDLFKTTSVVEVKLHFDDWQHFFGKL